MVRLKIQEQYISLIFGLPDIFRNKWLKIIDLPNSFGRLINSTRPAKIF
jgi:hypothetical protein